MIFATARMPNSAAHELTMWFPEGVNDCGRRIVGLNTGNGRFDLI
jgi:hypothetical protein